MIAEVIKGKVTEASGLLKPIQEGKWIKRVVSMFSEEGGETTLGGLGNIILDNHEKLGELSAEAIENVPKLFGKEFETNSKIHIPELLPSHKTKISSHANGTMSNGVPGFVSTNGFDAMQFHKNESVQVLNLGQKIERDKALEEQTEAIQEQNELMKKLLSIMLDNNNGNQNLVIHNEIDGREFSKLVVDVLRQKTEA